MYKKKYKAKVIKEVLEEPVKVIRSSNEKRITNSNILSKNVTSLRNSIFSVAEAASKKRQGISLFPTINERKTWQIKFIIKLKNYMKNIKEN